MSVYDSLIDALILGEEIIVDDAEFNQASFKTAFYRYYRTEFGKMIIGERKLQVSGNALKLVESKPKKVINFRVVSKSNEQQD